MNVSILGGKIIAVEEPLSFTPSLAIAETDNLMFLRFYIATDSFLSHYRRDSWELATWKATVWVENHPKKGNGSDKRVHSG